jgi:hypothetical protein
MKKYDNIETVPKHLWSPGRGWHNYYVAYDGAGSVWHIEVDNESKSSKYHWKAVRCNMEPAPENIHLYSRTLAQMSYKLRNYLWKEST